MNSKEHTGTATCLCDACQNREEFLWDLDKFMRAAQRLNKYWDENTAHTPDSLSFYPFRESFDEVASNIEEWRNAVYAAAARNGRPE